MSKAGAVARPLMQNMKNEWKPYLKTVRKLYPSNYDRASEFIQSLGYGDFYKNGSIMEMQSGNCVFSAALQNNLQPHKHVLMDPLSNCYKLSQALSKDLPGVTALQEDPFRWEMFNYTIGLGNIEPKVQPYSQVNDSLLLFVNLVAYRSKQLVAQLTRLACRRSWAFRYGRVRLLLLVESLVAERLMAPPGHVHRKRQSATREYIFDHRIVFWEPSTLKLHPNTLDPSMNPPSDWFGTIDPANRNLRRRPMTLLELTPKDRHLKNADEFEYCMIQLMVVPHTPLRNSLRCLGPGALEGMGDKLQDILDVPPVCLGPEQWDRVAEAFCQWPFRPDELFDYYEDDNAPNPYDRLDLENKTVPSEEEEEMEVI